MMIMNGKENTVDIRGGPVVGVLHNIHTIYLIEGAFASTYE